MMLRKVMKVIGEFVVAFVVCALFTALLVVGLLKQEEVDRQALENWKVSVVGFDGGR